LTRQFFVATTRVSCDLSRAAGFGATRWPLVRLIPEPLVLSWPLIGFTPEPLVLS
jgi:hypothetical protein